MQLKQKKIVNTEIMLHEIIRVCTDEKSTVSVLKCKLVTEHVVSTEQTGSFWIAELYDMWPLDCSAWGFLSIWQVRKERFSYLVRFCIFSLRTWCPTCHVQIFNLKTEVRTGHLRAHICLFSLCTCKAFMICMHGTFLVFNL